MRLLREREFRSLWVGQSVSRFGDQITVIALPLLAVLVLGVRTTLWVTSIGAIAGALRLLPSPVPSLHDLPEEAA